MIFLATIQMHSMQRLAVRQHHTLVWLLTLLKHMLGFCTAVLQDQVASPSSVGKKAFQALPAMVFTVQTFLAEMVATEELVKARNGQDPSFLQAMGTQLQHKLDHMAALSHQDAVALFQALANNQLPEEVTTTLTKSVETKLIQGGGNQASKTTMQAQELEHLQNYLTPSDWAKLEDTTMFQGVAQWLPGSEAWAAPMPKNAPRKQLWNC